MLDSCLHNSTENSAHVFTYFLHHLPTLYDLLHVRLLNTHVSYQEVFNLQRISRLSSTNLGVFIDCIALQAYECLSDKARRRAFNSDRKNNFCKDCYRKSQQQHPSAVPKTHNKNVLQTKQQKLIRAFREVQNRLREECRVIERCLRAHEGAGMESPLFDPSDRLHFPDYPHRRGAEDCWNFSWSSEYRRVKCESPVYQLRSESRRSWSKNPGFRFWCMFTVVMSLKE